MGKHNKEITIKAAVALLLNTLCDSDCVDAAEAIIGMEQLIRDCWDDEDLSYEEKRERTIGAILFLEHSGLIPEDTSWSTIQAFDKMKLYTRI